MWAEADGYWGVVQWRVATVAEVIAMFFLGIGGMSVLNGQLAIGSFVTALGSISTFGNTTASIFGAIFDLMKGYASVFEISDIFNAMTRRSELFKARERRLRLMKEWDKDKNKKSIDEGESGFRSRPNNRQPRHIPDLSTTPPPFR